MKTNQTTNNTNNNLNELINKRNELIKALEQHPNLTELTELKNRTINELCDTLAQISVYKTLFKLSDASKDISKSGADMCARLYRSFADDMRIYRTNDTNCNYSDAMDLYNIAYMQIWEYLHVSAPLTLSDTVLTVTNKSGNEKNYTIFQTACKSIREYIRTWSKSDNYKKIRYLIGYTENGEQVTTSKRPKDDINDINTDTIKSFFNRHNLTTREQEILSLYIKGENTDTIATLLNLNIRTIQRDIKTAKAKFITASAYAELITAQNAEKLAKAKADKNPADTIYQSIYIKAQERTAEALTEWKKAFTTDNR